MATKTEERLKQIIKEYLDEKQQEISSNISTIFLWGILTGIILSYTNLLSIIAGMSIGYIIAKKEIPFIDYAIIRTVAILDYKRILKITENIIPVKE